MILYIALFRNYVSKENEFIHVYCRQQTYMFNQAYRSEFLKGIIMNSKANIIWAITWILTSPLWFFLNNTTMGIIWLCGGIVELIIGLIRHNKEKKRK